LSKSALESQNIWHRAYRLALKLEAPACIAGPTTMVICDLISINLNHTLNPLDITISQYAISPFGWLEKAGILLVSISFMLVGANLLDSAKKMKSQVVTISGVLFLMVACGFLMVIIFN
jgi:hypothetical protein